jgi:hypothetical protein
VLALVLVPLPQWAEVVRLVQPALLVEAAALIRLLELPLGMRQPVKPAEVVACEAAFLPRPDERAGLHVRFLRQPHSFHGELQLVEFLPPQVPGHAVLLLRLERREDHVEHLVVGRRLQWVMPAAVHPRLRPLLALLAARRHRADQTVDPR